MTRCVIWALAIALIVLPELAATADPFESKDIHIGDTKHCGGEVFAYRLRRQPFPTCHLR